MKRKLDEHGLFSLLIDIPKQMDWVNSIEIPALKKKFEKIMICGMGGSAISALIAKDIFEKELKIPIFVYSQEKIPAFIDENTLVIPISYSGGTKETMNMIRNSKGAHIISISAKKNFTENNIEIPSGLPPRFAFYQIFSALTFLISKNFIPGFMDKYDDMVKNIKKTVTNLIKKENIANTIAENLTDRPVVIYSSSALKSVAYRWKTQINENAKHHAFCHYFPEMTHNEIVPYVEKNNFRVILLRSSQETVIEKKQMDFFKGFTDIEIEMDSENYPEEVFKMTVLGDFVSYYMAILKGIDPYDIVMIDRLKSKL